MSGPKEITYKTPFADWETRAYWEGCGRGELVLQRCRQCSAVQHRPRGLCVSCLSDDIEHFVASGRGTVYACTVTYQNGLPAFRDACPYVLAYVDLDEGPRLMTNIVGCKPEDVHVDMKVKVDFAAPSDAADQPSPTSEAFKIPRFVPA